MFTLTDDELAMAHPDTYAHRIRAVDVFIDAPGTLVQVRGMLTNGGFSRFRRELGGTAVPLLRFADAYPVSEFHVRGNAGLYGAANEQLSPFEGSGFATSWTLELPKAANATGLNRIGRVAGASCCHHDQQRCGRRTSRKSARCVAVDRIQSTIGK